MATTITAGNATNGAAVSSDNTGTLQLKTGTGAGTTAISIDASQVVTMPGPVAIPGNLVVTGTITAGAGSPYVLNSYVAPATWTKPTGLKSIKVTVVGAGGAGGPVTPSTPSNSSGGGGGGAGGAAIEYIPAPSIPGPVAVTAGPGTNSFGAFCSATAGSNGATAGGGDSGAGGAGGVGSGGTIDFTGGGGVSGVASGGVGGAGGNSLFGSGARGITTPGPVTNTAGASGGNYGGGGSGAGKITTTGGASGGAGAPGIVIVEEFY